jgi:hypothetical protein
MFASENPISTQNERSKVFKFQQKIRIKKTENSLIEKK